MSLADALRVRVINNTIAHNDSTATNRAAFLDPNNPNLTTPQPGAGIVSRAHSAALAGVLGAPGFSNPQLYDSIVFENRSFYWDGSANGGLGALLPDPSSPVYSDLGVIGTAGSLTCNNCIVTGGTPSFVSPYFNELFAAGAGGEGGNFVSVVFRPLKQTGNYHISAPNDVGQAAFVPPDFPELAGDFDGQARPRTAPLDAGADEFLP